MRDYHREMIEAIDGLVPEDGGFTSAEIAEKLVARLQGRDADLLQGWLSINAQSIMRAYITDLLNRRRRAALQRRGDEERSVFSRAVRSHERGEAQALQSWLDVTYVVDDENTRKRLSAMVKSDLVFVIDDYRRRAAENTFEAEFLAAIARRVTGTKKVGEVWTHERVNQVRERLSQ